MAFQMGRIPPIAQYDFGHFRAVVGSDGVTRYFPRIVKHWDSAKRIVLPPPGPLGRKDKAMAAIKRMYANDTLGDCVLASRAHKIGILSGNDTGNVVLAADSEVVADYHAACGVGDNGCNMSVVNTYEKNTGLMMSGVRHKSDGSVAIDNKNVNLVKTCLVLFGTLNIGLNLPQEWYDAPDGGDWGVTTTAIIGGHEVQGFDYDEKGVWIATWAGTRRILWDAFTSGTWIDELYTSLNKDWYNDDNLAPNGIDAATLAADLAIAASGQVPPLPEPVPTPPQPPQPPVSGPTLQQFLDVAYKRLMKTKDQLKHYPSYYDFIRQNYDLTVKDERAAFPNATMEMGLPPALEE